MRRALVGIVLVLSMGCIRNILPGHGGDPDGDGIEDDVDKCPTVPEDFDGFEDEDGCPEPDNDHDGVLDVDDKCPNIPGPISTGGCPGGAPSGKDRDGDGIPDSNDACPDNPEDRDGFQDHDGCPDPDNDKDGILDQDDQCPNEPGTIAKGGCP
jgi:OmpA-OmpF porin, OOP family